MSSDQDPQPLSHQRPSADATGVEVVGRVPLPGAVEAHQPSGKSPAPATPGSSRAPSAQVANQTELRPRRLRRLHRVWPDREGNISYLLTICVDDRARVLDNEDTFQRLVAFLLDSPQRYRWFGRRFVIMPDHIHLIAHQGFEAVRLGQWVKALKAVAGGLECRAPVGRVPLPGAPVSEPGVQNSIRIKHSWRWQDGFHDHKFRTPESESRKWEYVCLNPVRYHLVQRPEDWLYGGEIFYDDADGPRLERGTPPLLETGILIEEKPMPPGKGTRPTG